MGAKKAFKVISRDDFLDAIEALWPVAKFENSEDLLRVKVWSTVSSAFLSRPRYIFELSTR